MSKLQVLVRLVLGLALWAGLPVLVFGQVGSDIWYFGHNAGVSFMSDPPVALNDGALITNEGCATITDQNGNLLMYTDGVKVFNRLHQQMPNGFGLLGHSSSTQTGLIVPQPGTDSVYFIFTTGNIQAPLCYSKVNINLDNGLGDVTIKNEILKQNANEQLTAVKHANGIDYWVVSITPGVGNGVMNPDTFNVFLVNNTGIITTPISYINALTSVYVNHAGQMKFSPDGSK
ncbi:MAG: hypothetical protein EOP51_26255, partial [Sphingobacteriales bacterium]